MTESLLNCLRRGELETITGHFGHKTLRQRCRSFSKSQHISVPDRGKVATLRMQDNFDETAPPVIRLKLGAEVSKWFSAEVFGRFGPCNFVVSKCLVAQVFSSR